jgi:hypothetical protein
VATRRDSAAFWKLIDQTRADAAKPYRRAREPSGWSRQNDLLFNELKRSKPAAIVSFTRQLFAALNELNRYDVWGVAHVILGRCTDDEYGDFCEWVISRGKRVFDAVLRDPQTIAAAIPPPGELPLDDGLLAVTDMAGEEADVDWSDEESIGVDSSRMVGKPWKEADLPRLHASLVRRLFPPIPEWKASASTEAAEAPPVPWRLLGDKYGDRTLLGVLSLLRFRPREATEERRLAAWREKNGFAVELENLPRDAKKAPRKWHAPSREALEERASALLAEQAADGFLPLSQRPEDLHALLARGGFGRLQLLFEISIDGSDPIWHDGSAVADRWLAAAPEQRAAILDTLRVHPRRLADAAFGRHVVVELVEGLAASRLSGMPSEPLWIESASHAIFHELATQVVAAATTGPACVPDTKADGGVVRRVLGLHPPAAPVKLYAIAWRIATKRKAKNA